MFCLMPDTAQKFKQAIKDGKIDPAKLTNMSSVERNDYFGQIVGKNHAQAVNSLFESKLLLKNQKKGLVTWAKQVSGIKPAARRDLIKKIERMQNVLDPEEGKQFMRDLTATRLGVNITEAEARVMADLSKKVSDFEALRRADKTFPSKDDRMNYGRAVEDLTDFVADLKRATEKITFDDIRNRREGLMGKFTQKAFGNMKSMSAALDNSAVFRQGWKVLFRQPDVWAKNAAQTFVTAAKTVGGKNVMREVNADVISRPNYEKYVRGGLAIKNAEEAFPESLPEKIPALGRLYKASQDAFTAFQYKNRADIADKMLKLAEKKGVNTNDPKELKAIMESINILTARGNLGSLEKNADLVNSVFFSPRFLASQIQTITRAFPKGLPGSAKTDFARDEARKALATTVGGTFSVLAAASALMPEGSVEWDPRSSNFGKIRIGDTRFDVTGGMGSLITFLSRIATNSSKSASTDKITEFGGDEIGARTQWDAVIDFFTNKASPGGRIIVDKFKGENFDGEEFNLAKSLGDTATPIMVQNLMELQENPRAADVVMAAISDGLGIGTNTYSAADFSAFAKRNSKEIEQFKAHVSEEEFKKADEQYQKEYNDFIDEVRVTDDYKNKTTEEKTKLLAEKKKTIEDAIFDKYNFEPEY